MKFNKPKYFFYLNWQFFKPASTLTPETSYETSRGWNREQIEHRTSNVECTILMTLRCICLKKSGPSLQCAQPSRISKGRFDGAPQTCALRVVQYFFKLTEFNIRCWTFNGRCSTLISFFSDQTGRCFGRRLG